MVNGLSVTDEVFIDSFLTSRMDRFETAARELGDLRVFHVVAAVFVSVMMRDFIGDPSGQQISAYASSVTQKVEGTEIPQVVVEAVLRAAFGEEGVLQDIPATLATGARIAVLMTRFHDEPLSGDEREEIKEEVADFLHEL